jgi:hypothetical protein
MLSNDYFVSNSYFTVIFPKRFDYLSHLILMYAGLLLSRHTIIIQSSLDLIIFHWFIHTLNCSFNSTIVLLSTNIHSFQPAESFIIHTDNFHSLIYLSLIMMTYYSLILTYRQSATVNNT